ncbi:MAG: hypothetical protein RIQ93_2434 [Verrucomicrobiota bacterium]|jgi:outer membrane protein assembly factor BamB
MTVVLIRAFLIMHRLLIAVFSISASHCLADGSAPARGEEWPEFRGPTGQGHATARGLPLEWSTTKNVVWKQPVPGVGWSSPVVSRGRVILTTGVSGAEGRAALQVLCFEVNTGQLAWTTEVFPAEEAAPKPGHAKGSPASPTAIIEGDRIYAHFGHRGTACLDRDGKLVWRNDSLGYDPVHGNGGSPVLVGDFLIYNGDGATEPFVVALAKKTGAVAWKVRRGASAAKQNFSFCTPLLINAGGRAQLITPGSGAVFALDPQDGRELWRVRYGTGYSVVPRPVFGHGLVFIGTGFNRADLLAIRVDGEGDVTDTHVAWRTAKGAPLTPSVLLVGDELYAVSDMGVATCFDAKSGDVHWQERIDGNYSASPLAAAGRIYFQNETGTGTVLKADKKFTKLATNELGERTLASYAVTGESLLIRTEQFLYRIGQRGDSGAESSR